MLLLNSGQCYLLLAIQPRFLRMGYHGQEVGWMLGYIRH